MIERIAAQSNKITHKKRRNYNENLETFPLEVLKSLLDASNTNNVENMGDPMPKRLIKAIKERIEALDKTF